MIENKFVNVNYYSQLVGGNIRIETMKSFERKERLRRLSEMNRRALGVSSFEAPESYTKGDS